MTTIRKRVSAAVRTKVHAVDLPLVRRVGDQRPRQVADAVLAADAVPAVAAVDHGDRAGAVSVAGGAAATLVFGLLGALAALRTRPARRLRTA